MKNKQFKKLSEIERKTILCAMIAKRQTEKYFKEDITNIVNSLDINCQYTIKVVTDAKEFTKVTTLYQHGFSHSWAGSEGVKQEGVCLFGNVEFGINRYWEYSDNGRMTQPDIQNIDPNFEINKTAVVLITENDWDNYNNSCNEHDDWFYRLRFYIPESEPYKIDDKLKALIAFNIEQVITGSRRNMKQIKLLRQRKG